MGSALGADVRLGWDLHLGLGSALGAGICTWDWDLFLGMEYMFLGMGSMLLVFMVFIMALLSSSSFVLLKTGVMSHFLPAFYFVLTIKVNIETGYNLFN